MKRKESYLYLYNLIISFIFSLAVKDLTNVSSNVLSTMSFFRLLGIFLVFFSTVFLPFSSNTLLDVLLI